MWRQGHRCACRQRPVSKDSDRPCIHVGDLAMLRDCLIAPTASLCSVCLEEALDKSRREISGAKRPHLSKAVATISSHTPTKIPKTSKMTLPCPSKNQSKGAEVGPAAKNLRQNTVGPATIHKMAEREGSLSGNQVCRCNRSKVAPGKACTS